MEDFEYILHLYQQMSSFRRNNMPTSHIEMTRAYTLVQPQAMDVMLGRGKSYRKNPGNMAFQGNSNKQNEISENKQTIVSLTTLLYYSSLIDLVQMNRLKYFDSTTTGKREIVMGILNSIKSRGQFLKMKDGRWTIVSDETARQKIAHAIQYQIRNDFSQQHEGDKGTTARKSNVRPAVKNQDAIATSSGASVSQQPKSHAPISLPRSGENSKTKRPVRLQDTRGFLQDGMMFDHPMNEGNYHTSEAGYHQWLSQKSDDYLDTAATTAVSDIFDTAELPHPKFKDGFDPYMQNSRRALTDQIDYTRQQRYPYDASQYDQRPLINAMAYDLFNDHQHIIERRNRGTFENHNRKFSLPDQVDSVGPHHFGILLNDSKIPAPPAPVVHSLDVSGVSLWDGCVSFHENCEHGEVVNDDADPIAFSSVVSELNVKQHVAEHWVSNLNQNIKPALKTTSIEAGPTQRLSSTLAALKHPPNTRKTRNDTVLELTNAPIPSPMDTLVRAASDFSRDDSSWE